MAHNAAMRVDVDELLPPLYVGVIPKRPAQGPAAILGEGDKKEDFAKSTRGNTPEHARPVPSAVYTLYWAKDE